MSLSENLKVAIQHRGGAFVVGLSSDGQKIITDGYEAGLLNMVLQAMMMNYSLHSPGDGQWGTKHKNGSWSGLIGMIQRNEADIAVGSLGVTEERQAVVTYSDPYTFKEMTFATKWPDMLPKHDAFVKPFGEYVWISLLVSLAVLPFVFQLVIFSTSRLQRLIFIVASILLRQSISIGVVSYRSKVFLGTWVMSAMLISSIYSSVLLAFLSVPLRQGGIQTIKQLSDAIKDGSYTCATLNGTFIAESLLKSSDASAKLIGEYIINNDFYIEPTKKGTSDYIFSGKKAAVVRSRETIKMLFQDSLFISKQAFFSTPNAIATRKDFRFIKRLNMVINRIVASGVPNKDIDHYTFKQKLTSPPPEELDDPPPQQLSLEDLSSIFILLISGNILACVVLISEIIYSSIKNNYWRMM